MTVEGAEDNNVDDEIPAFAGMKYKEAGIIYDCYVLNIRDRNDKENAKLQR